MLEKYLQILRREKKMEQCIYVSREMHLSEIHFQCKTSVEFISNEAIKLTF